MTLYNSLMNKKGDMPWWLATTILALAVLLFVLFMIIMARKGMYSNILDIFKRW